MNPDKEVDSYQLDESQFSNDPALRNHHVKSWKLTEERALQLYEVIQQTLDPNTWEVFINSEQDRMTLKDFKSKARKRLHPYAENYAPSLVADDCLVIMDSLEILFENVRTRLEDSFKSILIVNEDLNEYVSKLESESSDSITSASEVQKLNSGLIAENQMLRQKLTEKEDNLQPLVDIANVQMAQIISLFNQFKTIMGDDKEVKRFKIIFDKEIARTVKLLETRRKLLTERATVPATPVAEDVEEKVESMPSDQQEEVPDENASFGNSEENPIAMEELSLENFKGSAYITKRNFEKGKELYQEYKRTEPELFAKAVEAVNHGDYDFDMLQKRKMYLVSVCGQVQQMIQDRKNTSKAKMSRYPEIPKDEQTEEEPTEDSEEDVE